MGRHEGIIGVLDRSLYPNHRDNNTESMRSTKHKPKIKTCLLRQHVGRVKGMAGKNLGDTW